MIGEPGGVREPLMLDELPLPEPPINASIPLAWPGGSRVDGGADDGVGWKREWEKGRGCMEWKVSGDGAEARS